jgi:hypothetical protein
MFSIKAGRNAVLAPAGDSIPKDAISGYMIYNISLNSNRKIYFLGAYEK